MMREPEPEAHCYDCPNRYDKCNEYKTLNPEWMRAGLGEYDRGACHWGHESIRQLATKEDG